jgi:polysaccharide export outer membrane protein
MNPHGTVTRRRIRIDFSQDINEQTNPILWDRDVIIVNRNSLAAVGDTLGTLLNPVGQAFSLFNLFRVFFPQSP